MVLKQSTESDSTLSYLDVSISICHGQFVTEVYDKRDNFNFNIVNYPFIGSNIPARPTYGVYISQLIRINRICENFAPARTRYSQTETLSYLREERVDHAMYES